MLVTHKMAQLVPQLSPMWRVVSGRGLSPHGLIITPLPLITRHAENSSNCHGE